tara:strand:+ start:811 stop:966 length:156 start_codon:yes stop_codon:yes gene_type:complete
MELANNQLGWDLKKQQVLDQFPDGMIPWNHVRSGLEILRNRRICSAHWRPG